MRTLAKCGNTQLSQCAKQLERRLRGEIIGLFQLESHEEGLAAAWTAWAWEPLALRFQNIFPERDPDGALIWRKDIRTHPTIPHASYTVSNSSDNPTPNTPASHLARGAKRRPIGMPPALTPSRHAAQLQRWIREWNIYRALGSSPTEAKDDLPVTPYVLPVTAGVQLPPGLIPPSSPHPSPSEPGVIRLLDSALVPGAQRPVYVLILADWADGRKLIAPFGPFSTPAATMELQTNREEPHLAVICLWNARVLAARLWRARGLLTVLRKTTLMTF